MRVTIRCFEIVLFPHVCYHLVQSFPLGNEEITDFVLMFGPIQGCLAIWGHLVDQTVGCVDQ